MSAATAISITIPFSFIPSRQSLNFIPGVEFPNRKITFSGQFAYRKPVCRCRRAWNSTTMTGSIAASAFRGGTGDEDLGALEQESFVGGSSQFRPNLTFVGIESTLNRLSKWVVAALFGAVILLRHDAQALWAAMGSVINSLLSNILKKLLNQERPVSTLRSDPGMPSSHAQSIFFTVIFVIISMVQWLGMNGLTLILSCLTLVIGIYLSWLRVSQQLHTISQVVVGAGIGSVFSILWLWSWDAFVVEAFTSNLWIRISVLFGAVGFCLGFLVYIIHYWIMDNR